MAEDEAPDFTKLSLEDKLTHKVTAVVFLKRVKYMCQKSCWYNKHLLRRLLYANFFVTFNEKSTL